MIIKSVDFKGKYYYMSDWRHYNRVLSDDEIQVVFKHGATLGDEVLRFPFVSDPKINNSKPIKKSV